MKTDLTTSGSFAQSKLIGAHARNSKDMVPKPLIGKLPDAKGPDYKVDLSSASRPSPLPSITPPLPGIPAPSLPSLPDLPDSNQLQDMAKDKLVKASSEKVKEIKKEEIKQGSVKKPAVLFIKGLDIFSDPLKSEGGYAGMGRMAESINGSKVYEWNQEDEIIDEIKKVHHDFPVVLVGHSLGGDTALEIADQLDTLDEGFRPVELLITLDAVGLSHDIVPQNVKKHLNVFGESSLLLNDGPHVARREEKTNVRNILSPLDHTDIDDNREIQFEVVDLIRKTLGDKA